QPQDQEEEGDPNERVLKTMKANYGAAGGRVPLLWKDGVFVRQDEQQALSIVDKLEIDRLVIEGLRQLVSNDTKAPCDPNAPNGFANAVRKLPACKHLAWAAVVSSQERLLSAGKVAKVELGPPSRRRVYLRPADMLYPGEWRQAE